MITFNEFRYDSELNEGIFDPFINLFKRIANLFRDPGKVQNSVSSAMESLGEAKTRKFLPKQLKVSESYWLMMGDISKPSSNFSIAITKLADMPDGSSLFQLVGTTNAAMLKSLVNSDKISDLAKNNVMILISKNGLEKGSPATMRILKNIMKDGKDYVSQTTLIGAVPENSVQMNFTKLKTRL